MDKRTGIILFVILLVIPSCIFARLACGVLPVKAANYNAKERDLDDLAFQVITDQILKNSERASLRQNIEETVKEFENRMTGLYQEGQITTLQPISYCFIPTIGYIDKKVIFDIRIMDIETLEIVQSLGFISKEKKFEKQCREIVQRLLDLLEEEKRSEDLSVERNRITIYKIQEIGDGNIKDSVISMLYTGLSSTVEFVTVERESTGWAVQEKAAIMAGIVDRDPLKKAKQFYNIQLSLEGIVVTKNPGIYSVELKLVDVENAKLIFMLYDECYSLESLRYLVKRMVLQIEKKYFTKYCSLLVKTDPVDASIYINGRYIALSPCKITELEESIYQFAIKKDGYQNRLVTKELIYGEDNIINISLQPIIWEYYNNGLKQEARSEWRNAINSYVQFIKVNQDSEERLDAQFRIAHIYQYGLKNYESAIAHYRELLKSYPSLQILSETLYGIGQCLIILGNKEEGIQTLQKLINEYPQTSAADYAVKKIRSDNY